MSRRLLFVVAGIAGAFCMLYQYFWSKTQKNLTMFLFFLHLDASKKYGVQNMKKIAILLAYTLMLFGCAMNGNSKSNLKEANVMNDNLTVFGAYKAEIVEIVTWVDNDVCNKTAFMLYAREEKKIDKLVDIIMKETCADVNPGTLEKNCSCKYSGIGMKYRQLDAHEAALWGAMSNSASPRVIEESIQAEPSGPATEGMFH